MASEQLLNFIRQARQTDTPDEQIRQSLLRSGWQAQDIQEAFISLGSQSLGGTGSIATLGKKYLLFIIAVAVSGLLIGGYFVSAQFGLFPNLGKSKETVLSDEPRNTILVKNEKAPSVETTKIGVGSGIDKFYYAIIEKGDLVYPVGQGSYNYELPDIVTIYKYDIDEMKLAKVFGPYPTEENYLEEGYTPRLASSENGNVMTFSDSMLFTFLGGTEEFKIIAPHKDIVTENVASPVLSPDGSSIVYSVGSQINMFDKTTGEYRVLIKDTTQISRGAQNFHGTSVYPAFWYKKDNDDHILIEVRSKNQNNIPLALTGFYIYSFSNNAYTPVSFYYAPGKKIQQCSGYDWSCEQSPIVLSRSPHGQYQLVEGGDTGILVIDYSLLATDQSGNLESATKVLPACKFYNREIVWSYDSKKLLCSGLAISFNEQFSNLAIATLKNNKPFNLAYTYTTIDVKTGAVINSSEEKLHVSIPQETRDDFLDHLQRLDDQLAKKGIAKGSEEYNTYTSQLSWDVFLTLQSSAAQQAKNVIGWVGVDKYLATKTKFDEQYNDPISQEIILTDLKGNDKTLEIYSTDPDNKLEGQGLIEKLKSANVSKETLSGLQRDIVEGRNFFATIGEVYIKYLGSVSP